MSAILVTLLPYLLAGGVSLVGWLWADHGWCNGACQSQKSRADKLQTTVDAAQKRATDLALLYANTLTRADKETQDALKDQRTRFSALASDASHLNTLPSIVLGAPTVVVLNGITDAANAATAPQVGNGAGETISESDLAARWNQAGTAYGDAVTKLNACINFYGDLRNEQIH